MPSTAEYLQEFIERSSDPSVIHDIGVMLCKKISASAKITSRSIKGDTTTLVCLELQHVAWKRLRELSLESVQTEVKSESRAELEARLARVSAPRTSPTSPPCRTSCGPARERPSRPSMRPILPGPTVPR